MKRTLLLTIILCTILPPLFAQQEDFRYWSRSKLSWDDFKGNMNYAGLDCELKYFLTYNTDKQTINDTTIYRIKACCYVDRNLSWAKPGIRTDRVLNYFQVVFDIVELHRRKLQFTFDTLTMLNLADAKLHSAMFNCEDMLAKLKQETHQGDDTLAVQDWKTRISSELAKTAEKRIPDFTKKNFGYGGHVGFGAGFNSGTLGDHFAPSFNFIFGFDLAYKDVTLFLCATLAGTKALTDYNGDINMINNERIGLAILDCSLGYPVVNTAKIKFSPFAGFGLLEYSKHAEPGTANVEIMVSPAFLFGLNTDYKIRKNLSLIPETFLQTHEYSEISIRARLYIAKANMAPDIQGFSINFTLGIGMYGNIVRL